MANGARWKRSALTIALMVLAATTTTGCFGKKAPEGAPLAFVNQQKIIDGLADREYVAAWSVFAGVAEMVPKAQFTGTAYEVHPFYTTVLVLGDVEVASGKPPINADGRINLLIEDPQLVFGPADSSSEKAVGSRFKFTVMERRDWSKNAKDRIMVVQPPLRL